MTDDHQRPDADPEAVPSVEEALRVIETQRRTTAAQFEPDPLKIYLPWGLSWLVGFGAFALHLGVGGSDPIVDMPGWLPGWLLAIGTVAALVWTMVLFGRASRHVVGASNRRGGAWGLAWFLGFAGVMSAAGRIADYVPEPEVNVLFPGLALALVGTLYVVGYAIFEERALLILGLIIAGVTIVATNAGTDWFFVIATIGGGGTLCIAPLVLRPGWKRARG